MIEVPCEPHERLIWDEQKQKASVATHPFYWKLNLGLEKPFFPLRDELVFSSLKLAVEQFVKELLPLGGNGVIFYQGSIDLAKDFDWNEAMVQEYKAWDLKLSKRAFAIDCFGNYFQMLSHLLPDETPIFLLFEPIDSAAETLFLLSRPSLEHFQIAFKSPSFCRKGWRWDENLIKVEESPKKGLVLPEGYMDFAKFDSLSKDCELVLESRLNEEWDGLEEIDLPVEKLSARGERMLLGFIAAGGKVNRGRGI